MERQTKPANEILDFKQANPRWWREIHRNENWTRELRGAIAIFLKKNPKKPKQSSKRLRGHLPREVSSSSWMNNHLEKDAKSHQNACKGWRNRPDEQGEQRSVCGGISCQKLG